MILRYSHCFLSLPPFSPRSDFPPSHVWVACVRPAVVLFYDLALFVLRLICSPLFYAGRHPRTSFIFHPLHTPRSLDLMSCLRFPTITTPSLCSVSSSLALDFIVCAYYFSAFGSLRCANIFCPTFFSVYIPLRPLFSHNLVLSYLHLFTARSPNH